MEIEIIMEYIIEHIDGNMIKCPRVLYKYRTWNDANHKKVLNENSLYMASPRKFDDIKDCRVPQNSHLKKSCVIISQLKINLKTHIGQEGKEEN